MWMKSMPIIGKKCGLGPVQTMGKLREEKRLDQLKCKNAQSPSSRPSHKRPKSKERRLQKSLGGKTFRKLWRQEFGLSSKVWVEQNAQPKLPSRGRTVFSLKYSKYISGLL